MICIRDAFEDFGCIHEGNAAGKEFEREVCNNTNTILKNYENINAYTTEQIFDKNLNEVEFNGRLEDYSDVCVMNEHTGKVVFIECKEDYDAQVANMKFDLTEDGKIVFVSKKSRQKIAGNDATDRLSEDLQNTDRYRLFFEFMNSKNMHLNGDRPCEYYFGRKELTQSIISKLAKLANSKLQKFKTSAHEIPDGHFAESTLKYWIVGLLWKLDERNKNHTYDICTAEIDYMSQLMLNHYSSMKKFPAFYIQVEDDLYVLDKNRNPLKLKAQDYSEITSFPKKFNGKYTLKLTPRLSDPNKLKMYFDARSYFFTRLPKSNCTLYKDTERFPKINCNKSK